MHPKHVDEIVSGVDRYVNERAQNVGIVKLTEDSEEWTVR